MEKTYIANVKGNITEEKIENLRNGVDIGGYITKPAKVRIISKDNNEIEIKISEGKNRQVRKMCENVGLRVLDLKRTSVGKLNLGNLKIGKYRYLNKNEIDKI